MAGFSQPQHFFAAACIFGFLDLCVPVLEVHVSSWAPGYFYLRFGVTQIFDEKKYSDIFEVRGVLKTSCHWLFNGVKQNNHNVIFDCMIMA